MQKCWPCQDKIDKMDPAMLAVGHEVDSDPSDAGDSDDDDNEDHNYYVSHDEDDDDETTTATGGVTLEDTSIDNTTTTGNTQSLSYLTGTSTPSGASISREVTVDGISTTDGFTTVGARSGLGNRSETASTSGLNAPTNRSNAPLSGFNPGAYGRPKSSRAASLAHSAASTRATGGSRDRFPKVKAYVSLMRFLCVRQMLIFSTRSSLHLQKMKKRMKMKMTMMVTLTTRSAEKALETRVKTTTTPKRTERPLQS